MSLAADSLIHETQGLSAEAVLAPVLAGNASHVIQGNALQIKRRREAARLLQENPDLFFLDPVASLLGGPPEGKGEYPLNSTSSKRACLEFVAEFLGRVPGSETIRESVLRIADELFTNFPSNGRQGRLAFGFRENCLVVGSLDSEGKLDPIRALNRVRQCYQQGVGNTMRSLGEGAGIGIFSIYDLCAALSLAVKSGQCTAVFCELPLRLSFRQGLAQGKSLHVYFDWDRNQKGRGMKSLKIEKRVSETPEGEISFELEGAIDEDANFASHPLSAAADKVSVIRLDLNQVTALNSCGMREWIQWMQTSPPSAKITFHRCPKAVVDQINMVEGFLPKGAGVESFYVPYYCEGCEKTSYALFKKGRDFDENGVKERAPENCSGCGKAMEMDVMPAKYFKFLRSAG